MAAVNPYQSPKTAQAVPSVRPQPTYRSRGHALFAGLWRGARLGGTWMAIILGAIAATAWLLLIGVDVYRWLVEGADPSSLFPPADLFTGVAVTLATIIATSFWAAVVGGLIMGVAAAITHRKPGREADADPAASHPF